MDLELRRNLFHLVIGVAVAIFVAEVGRKISIMLFSIALISGLILSEILEDNRIPVFSFFIDKFERQGQKPGIGVLTFFAGSLATLIVFKLEIAFIAILLLAFIDSFATILGKAFGKIKIYGEKTLTGSLGGFIVGLAVAAPFLSPIQLIVACGAGSLSELLLPYDNLSIPLAVGVALGITTILI